MRKHVGEGERTVETDTKDERGWSEESLEGRVQWQLLWRSRFRDGCSNRIYEGEERRRTESNRCSSFELNFEALLPFLLLLNGDPHLFRKSFFYGMRTTRSRAIASVSVPDSTNLC